MDLNLNNVTFIQTLDVNSLIQNFTEVLENEKLELTHIINYTYQACYPYQTCRHRHHFVASPSFGA